MGETGPGLGIGSVVSLLQGLIGLFGGSTAATWGSIAGTNNFGFSSLNDAFTSIGDVATKVKRVFSSIWNDVILAFLKKLLDAYKKLRDLLTKIFAPVINFLKMVRRLYDQYFNQFVKPVLNILQKVRAFLKIFELLGFKWAKRLDADIANIQNKITQVYTTLRKYLNDAISIIQIVVDPSGILRRNPLFAAILRSGNEVKNLMYQVQGRDLTPDESDRQARDRAGVTVSQQRQNFVQYYSQRQLTPDDEDSRKCFLAYFDALQNGTDVSF